MEGSDLILHGIHLLDFGEVQSQLLSESSVIELIIKDVEGLMLFLLGFVEDFGHNVVLVG